MKKYNALGTIQLGEDYILFSLNPQIYPLDIVKKAAREMTKKACVILDGNPTSEILVELRPKKEAFIQEFTALLNA